MASSGSERVTVHALRHGVVLCGNVHGRPGSWDPSQRWYGYNWGEGRALISCAICREALEVLEPRIQPLDPPFLGELAPLDVLHRRRMIAALIAVGSLSAGAVR